MFVVVIIALQLPAPKIDASVGDLTQLAGLAGCISSTGSGGRCAVGHNVSDLNTLAISPDGTSVYALGFSEIEGGGLTIFDRQTSGGAGYGQLTQKPGTAGCIEEPPYAADDGCAGARHVIAGTGLAVSPDGTSVYMTSLEGQVIIFDRDNTGGPTNGELVQKAGTLGCIGWQPDCGVGHSSPDSSPFSGVIVVSHDGTSAYVADYSGTVDVFDRDSDGTLVQKAAQPGCVSEDGSSGYCADGVGLVHLTSITMSLDDRNVYVSGSALAIFDRDVSGFASNGALTQKPGTAGCISDDGSSGSCIDGHSLVFTGFLEVSSDGHTAYSTGTELSGSADVGGIAILDRSSTGELTQRSGRDGCISSTGSEGLCATGRAIANPVDLTISPDGASVYVADEDGSAVAIFVRNTRTGSSNFGRLVQRSGAGGCVSDTKADECTAARGLAGVSEVIVSPGGRSVYTGSVATNSAIATFARAGNPPSCSLVDPTVVGTNKDDKMVGTAGDDIMFGLDGNDTMSGGAGADILCGGLGKDVLIGGTGKDTMDGGPGKDTCSGGPDADQTKSC